jgi:hypothetical protein
LSSVAENNLLSKKLISDHISNEKSPARMSTQPTTPSTVGCNSPDLLFATPDGSKKHEESELEEHIRDSPILRQLETSHAGKPSNHPLITAVSARTVSPDNAFNFFTREATPEDDFHKAVVSETVNQIIAGLVPSPISSSKKSVRDLRKLSKSFQDIMECKEEIEQRSEQEMQQSLSKSLATCIEKDPAKEESRKPRKVVFGQKDDVSGTGVIMLGEPKDVMVTVDHAKFPGLADWDAFAISEMVCVHKKEEEKRNIIVERGKLCVDSQAGHIAVDALNESGRKVEVSPCRFVHLDDVGVSLCPFMHSSRSSDHSTDPWADSEFEMSEVVKGTNSVDSDSLSNFSDFITDCKWDYEEKRSRGAMSTETPFSKDVKDIMSDLGETFAQLRSELVQRLSCSHPLADLDENATETACLSPCRGDIDRTTSRNDDYYWLSDYLSTQDDRTLSECGFTQDDDSRTLSLDSSLAMLSFSKGSS